MSSRHWTQRAARLIQTERAAKYQAVLNWVVANRTAIEAAAEAPDEDDLSWKQRLLTQALELYNRSFPEVP